MNLNTKKINIYDICNIERAVAGKEYKAGTCFVKLSAVDESVGQIKEKGIIESRYAVFEPKKEINVEYMFIAIERCFPEFLRRYRTTINLQFGTLKHFQIDWHDSEEVQKYVVKNIKAINEELKMIEEQIKLEKEQKKWYLKKMML